MNQPVEYLQGMPSVTGSSVMSKEVYQSPKSQQSAI